MMFDRGRDNVISSCTIGRGYPFYGPVIGLSTPAGEEDLVPSCPNEAGYRRPCLLEGLSCIMAKGMDAGRIAVDPGKEGEHRIDDLHVCRGCSGMIKVDYFHTKEPFKRSQPG